MQKKNTQEGLVSNTAKSGAAARVGLILSAAIGIGLAAPSCSFIVDKNSHQCEANADCVNAGLGDTCTAEFLCTTASVSSGCTKNADCTASDAKSICRLSDKTCVKVTSAECTTIYPEDADFSQDNPFIVGSIFPTTGDYALLGKPLENGVKLALRDFDKNTNGLPPIGSGSTRQFILIGCDDQLDDTRAVAAANHLANTLKLPAIIGAAYSGTTIKLMTEVAKPAGTLMISPGATSDAITTLPDDGLLWRTAPPDSLQAKALKAYSTEVELRVRTKLGLQPSDKIRAAIVSNDDTYGIGLGNALQETLVINGMPAINQTSEYKRFEYTFESGSYATAANNILGHKPHIVFFIGFNEAVSDIMAPVESGWNEPSYKPQYVFSDGALVQELATAVMADPTLNQRISGTVPGTAAPLFSQFKTSYTTTFPDLAVEGDPGTFGAAGAYDAAYLLAFATATLNGKADTGKGLGDGLKRMSEGTAIKAGNGADITKAFTTLSASMDGKINFEGASGELDFDPATGEAPSDYLIWCVSNINMNIKIGELSGQIYKFKSDKIEGTLDSMKCPLTP